VNACKRSRRRFPLAHHLFTLILKAIEITIIFNPTIDGIVAVNKGFNAFTFPGRVTNERKMYPRTFSTNCTG
jgi:hypothetical protein